MYWRPLTMTVCGDGVPIGTESPAETASACASLLFPVRKRSGSRKESRRPNRRAMKPTSRAAIMVPSLTPSRRWAKIRERIALRIHKKEHDHGQVNEISEQDGDRDLQQMLRLKVPAQDDELDQDQQKAERDRELSQCKRKIQDEHIRDR